MSAPNINFKSVILFAKVDLAFLNNIKFPSAVNLVDYENMQEYLADNSDINLIVAFKPGNLDWLSSVIKRITCALIIEEKDKEDALELLKEGLYDFFIPVNSNEAELIFQMQKWESTIAIRDEQLNDLKSELVKIRNQNEKINILFDELESKTKQNKKELSEAIDELESFSYSVSHDLRAPLRAITGFSGILKEEYQDKLDGEGKRYIDIIQKGTLQMSNLIDELLSFSRVGRLELRKTLFDPTALINDIFIDVQSEYKKEYKFSLGSVVPIFGDANTLKQVFSNLIRNAFKFSVHAEHPTIEIGSKKVDDGCEYYVKDNGVGFDMRYADKLFMVFQRLHSDSEFEGSGVGLAIVDRILKKHGGKIKGESPTECGAGFYFWLPYKRKPK